MAYSPDLEPLFYTQSARTLLFSSLDTSMTYGTHPKFYILLKFYPNVSTASSWPGFSIPRFMNMILVSILFITSDIASGVSNSM